MAKKLYAVTNIKVSSEKTYEAGQEIDLKELSADLSKEQIKELYDAGAIEIKETEEVPEDKEAEKRELEEAPPTIMNPIVEPGPGLEPGPAKTSETKPSN